MISLIQIERPADRKLVEDWLQHRHVAQWWGDECARLEQFDETPAEQHALIALLGKPIGYLRWEIVEQTLLEAVGITGIPDGSVDVDIFIGEPTCLHGGFGPIALNILIDQLAKTTKVPMVGLCTSTQNQIAIRAFEKAGFSKHCNYDDPTFGPCFVMVHWLEKSP